MPTLLTKRCWFAYTADWPVGRSGAKWRSDARLVRRKCAGICVMTRWVRLWGCVLPLMAACNGLTGADEIVIGVASDDDFDESSSAGVGGANAATGASVSSAVSTSSGVTTSSSASSSSSVSSASSSTASSSTSSSASSSSSSSSSGQLDCTNDPNATKSKAYLCISGVD